MLPPPPRLPTAATPASVMSQPLTPQATTPLPPPQLYHDQQQQQQQQQIAAGLGGAPTPLQQLPAAIYSPHSVERRQQAWEGWGRERWDTQRGGRHSVLAAAAMAAAATVAPDVRTGPAVAQSAERALQMQRFFVAPSAAAAAAAAAGAGGGRGATAINSHPSFANPLAAAAANAALRHHGSNPMALAPHLHVGQQQAGQQWQGGATRGGMQF